jgi:hypothetical protein
MELNDLAIAIQTVASGLIGLALFFLANVAPGIYSVLRTDLAHKVMQHAVKYASEELAFRLFDPEDSAVETEQQAAQQIVQSLQSRVPDAISTLELSAADLTRLATSRINAIKLKGFAE